MAVGTDEEEEGDHQKFEKSSSLCDVSPPQGAGGGGWGTPGWGRNILLSTPVVAKRTSADGGGTEVSSQDEALEEAAVGTVGERGGRPGPHPKPNKGWGPSGACMRCVPLGLVGCLGGGVGERQMGVLVADSLVGIHPHPGPTRRGVRSRGEGRRKRNEARRERRRRGDRRGGAVGGGGWYFGVDGVAVGRDLECKEVECEGDEKEEAEKCGGEGEAGEMGDGVAN